MLCECECGKDAGSFSKTKTYRNQKKGDLRRFINGHNTKVLSSEEQSRRGKYNDGSALRRKGTSGWYIKINGKHEHRILAEQLLGRLLLPGEVVHHKDGNKQNNAPDNIEIFKNQSEHCSYHNKNRRNLRGALV